MAAQKLLNTNRIEEIISEVIDMLLLSHKISICLQYPDSE